MGDENWEGGSWGWVRGGKERKKERKKRERVSDQIVRCVRSLGWIARSRREVN